MSPEAAKAILAASSKPASAPALLPTISTLPPTSPAADVPTESYGLLMTPAAPAAPAAPALMMTPAAPAAPALLMTPAAPAAMMTPAAPAMLTPRRVAGGGQGDVLATVRSDAAAPSVGLFKPGTVLDLSALRAAETAHPVSDGFGRQAAPMLRQAETEGIAELPQSTERASATLAEQIRGGLKPQVGYAPEDTEQAMRSFKAAGAELNDVQRLDQSIAEKAKQYGLSAAELDVAMRGGVDNLREGGLLTGAERVASEFMVSGGPVGWLAWKAAGAMGFGAGDTTEGGEDPALLAARVFDLSSADRVVVGLTPQQRALARTHPEIGALMERRNASAARAFGQWSDAVRAGRSEAAKWYALRSLGTVATLGLSPLAAAAGRSLVGGEQDLGMTGNLGRALATGEGLSAVGAEALPRLTDRIFADDPELAERVRGHAALRGALWGLGLDLAIPGPAEIVRGLSDVTDADKAADAARQVRVADVVVPRGAVDAATARVADEFGQFLELGSNGNIVNKGGEKVVRVHNEVRELEAVAEQARKAAGLAEQASEAAVKKASTGAAFGAADEASAASYEAAHYAAKASKAAKAAAESDALGKAPGWVKDLVLSVAAGEDIPAEMANAAWQAEVMRELRKLPDAKRLVDMPTASEAAKFMDPMSAEASGSALERAGYGLWRKLVGEPEHPIFREVQTELKAAIDSGRARYEQATSIGEMRGGLSRGQARINATVAAYSQSPGQMFDDMVRLTYGGVDSQATKVETGGGTTGLFASGGGSDVAREAPKLMRSIGGKGGQGATPELAESVLNKLSGSEAFRQARAAFVRAMRKGRIDYAIQMMQTLSKEFSESTLAETLKRYDVGGYGTAIIKRGEMATEIADDAVKGEGVRGLVNAENFGEALHILGLNRWRYNALAEKMGDLDARWAGALMGRETLKNIAQGEFNRIISAAQAGHFVDPDAAKLMTEHGMLTHTFLAASRYYARHPANVGQGGSVAEDLSLSLRFKLAEILRSEAKATVAGPATNLLAKFDGDVDKAATWLAVKVDQLGVGRALIRHALDTEPTASRAAAQAAGDVFDAKRLNRVMRSAFNALHARSGMGAGPSSVARLIEEVDAFNPSVANYLRGGAGFEEADKLIRMWRLKEMKNSDAPLLTRTVAGLGLLKEQVTDAAGQVANVMKNSMTGGVGLFFSPRFHVTNALGAPQIVALQQGPGAVAKMWHPRTADVISALRGGSSGASDVLFTRSDGIWTVDRVADLIRGSNLQSSQIHAELMNDLGSLLVNSGLTRGGELAASPEQAGLIKRAALAILNDYKKAGRGPSAANEVANTVDTTWRTGLLLNSLEAGDDVETAIKLARDGMLDYGALPAWFKRSIGRAVWFSSFRAASAKALLRATVRHPGMVLAPERIAQATAVLNREIANDPEFKAVNPWAYNAPLVNIVKSDDMAATFARTLPGNVPSMAMADIVGMLSVVGPLMGDDPQRGPGAQILTSAKRAADFVTEEIAPPFKAAVGVGTRVAGGGDVGGLKAGAPAYVDPRIMAWFEQAGLSEEAIALFGLQPIDVLRGGADTAQYTRQSGPVRYGFKDGVSGAGWEAFRLALMAAGMERMSREASFALPAAQGIPSATASTVFGMDVREVVPPSTEVQTERRRMINAMDPSTGASTR